MIEPVAYIRQGRGAVRPYLYGELELPDLVAHAFGGQELERVQLSAHAYHVEMAVADSMIVLEVGKLPTHVLPWSCSIYLYVPDVDLSYALAIDWGAYSLAEPEDKPYGERQAGLRDSTGNTWWIATYTGGHDRT